MGVVSGSVWTGVFMYSEVENAKNKRGEEKRFIWIEPHALTMVANFYTIK